METRLHLQLSFGPDLLGQKRSAFVKYDSFQLYLANNILNNLGRLGFAYQYECNMSAISELQSRRMSSEVWIGI
jgi:hypothetical protein